MHWHRRADRVSQWMIERVCWMERMNPGRRDCRRRDCNCLFLEKQRAAANLAIRHTRVDLRRGCFLLGWGGFDTWARLVMCRRRVGLSFARGGFSLGRRSGSRLGSAPPAAFMRGFLCPSGAQTEYCRNQEKNYIDAQLFSPIL